MNFREVRRLAPLAFLRSPNHLVKGGTNRNWSEPVNNTTNPELDHVLNQARQELIELQQKKAELMKRIGTIKQTIAGLADLFGDGVLNDELLELLDRNGQARTPGFTSECRFALMDTRSMMTARAVRDWIREKNPQRLANHKDPLASVTTVLNRLVSYGEAEPGFLDGKRAYKWCSELPPPSTQEQRPSAP